MTHFFVTGASSLLGRAVVTALAGHGPVTMLHHESSVSSLAEIGGVTVVSGALGQLGEVRAAIRDADVVVHLAAATHAVDDETYRRLNVDGTADLLEQCRDGQHVVFVSSRTAGVDGGGYARSKLDAENLVRRRFPVASILRVGEVVSAGSSEGISSLLATAIRRRILIDFRHHGPVRYAPIDSNSVVQAVVAAACERLEGTMVVSMARAVDARDIRSALSISGRRVIRIPVPVALLRAMLPVLSPRFFAPDQLDRLVCEKDVATEDDLAMLGVVPPDLVDIVRSVIDAQPTT